MKRTSLIIWFLCFFIGANAQIKVSGLLLDKRNVPLHLQSKGQWIEDHNIFREYGLHWFDFNQHLDTAEAKKLYQHFDNQGFCSLVYDFKGRFGAKVPRIYIHTPSEKIDNIQSALGSRLKEWQKVPHMQDVYQADVRVANDQKLEEIVKEIESIPLVKYASLDFLFSPEAATNDPFYNLQWALDNPSGFLQGPADADIMAEEAWSLATGRGVKVAIVDCGVDTAHQDLINNMLHGFDAVGDGTFGDAIMTTEGNNHGSLCAGVVAAENNNSEGITGLAYNAKIVPVRIYYFSTSSTSIIGSVTWGVRGLNWATYVAEADVLSNSWGVIGPFVSIFDTTFANDALNRIANYGRDGKGTPLLFSSGNEGTPPVIWPASTNHTIAIGASNYCDSLKTPLDCNELLPYNDWGSSYGAAQDIVAPGTRIFSTDHRDNPNGTTGYKSTFNGTSAACPFAAATVALMLEANDGLTEQQIRKCLSTSAEKVGNSSYDQNKTYGSWSYEMGYGRLNAYQAILCAQSTIPDTATYKEPLNPEIKFYGNESYQNTLKVTVDSESTISVHVVNSLGQVCYQDQFTALPGHYYFDLHNKLPSSGLYIARAIVNDEKYTFKFWSPGY